MDFDTYYPAISDLRARAKRRIPHFVWEFLESADGDESANRLNRKTLDQIRLLPRVLRGNIEPDPAVTLMGRDYPLPFGVSPVGMSGLVWPDAERILARLAVTETMPYCLSTVTAKTPEQVGPHVGDQGWFQLYPPGDPGIRRDLLKRAQDAGFHTLILTVDVPAPSRRERQRRAELSNPFRVTPRIAMQLALRPAWSLNILSEGVPRLATLETYAKIEGNEGSTAHIGYQMRTVPDWDYVAALQAEWDGPVVLKGVLSPDDAADAVKAGVDAIWVSNHGGRQFSGAPASPDALPMVRAAVGPDFPVIFDGAVQSGTDILRAIALGADFVMLGRAFHYGVAAFGARGAAHVVHILRESLLADMQQLGIRRLTDVREHQWG